MNEIRLKLVNDWVIVPASLKTPDNLPRFNIAFPRVLASDAGADALIRHESAGGYEPPTRNLLEKVLRRGDLFIDVGAHWGLFTLQAATHPAGNIRAIAFEPDPSNASILFQNIVDNGLTEVARLVCAACGARGELAPLVTSTTMGHSIHGVALKAQTQGPAAWVSLVTLDAALAALPGADVGLAILKVDAEGFEPQVIAGAEGLLGSGRVALIIWEHGATFSGGVERSAMTQMIASLSDRGFRHFRPPHHEIDGPLIPFEQNEKYLGNVFSFGTEKEYSE